MQSTTTHFSPTGSSAPESPWFTSQELEEQLQSDRHAWRDITGILMAILAVGLLLGVSVVSLVWHFR